MIIYIEGNIGTGKSTFVDLLNNYIDQLEATKRYKVVLVQEPVDEWMEIKNNEDETILSKFYADQEKYSFPFQMMAYISRLNKLKNALNENKMTIFTERSLSTDKYVFAKMLYDSGKMNTYEYQIYSKWFDSFNEETEITHVIYVKSDAKICHERITKRSRSGESNISCDYLQQCNDYHDTMITKLKEKNIPVLVLDGHKDVYDNQVLKQWLNDIQEFISQDGTEGGREQRSPNERSYTI